VELEDNAKFCPECGTKVPQIVICCKCGAKLSSGVKFCPECGMRVNGSSNVQQNIASSQVATTMEERNAMILQILDNLREYKIRNKLSTENEATNRVGAIISTSINNQRLNIAQASNSTKSELDKMLDECLGEIKRVESELNLQLEEIGEKIDAGFTQMANLVETVTDFAVVASQGFISDKNRGKIELWGNVAAGAINAIGAAYNAYQHNKALDKLLVKKQEIATAKRASLQRILPVISKTHDKIEKLIVVEGNKSYELSKLENDSVRDLLFSNMDKILAAYRAAEYVSLTSEYLMAEYNSWLHGDQRSSIARPTYLDVNQNVVELLAPGNNNSERRISTTLSSTSKTLHGRSLFFLHDSSLTSVLLLGEGMEPDEEKPGEDTFVTQDIPIIHSNLINNIMAQNEAYQSFVSSASQYKEIKDNDHSALFGCLGDLLAVAGTWALFHYYFADWATWLQWVVGIITAGILVAIVSSIEGNMNEKTKEKLDAVNKKNFNDLISKTGYVEIQEPDLEKKSVLGTGVSGLLDMFLG
jgi:hypothetical protein